jgi:hypothetical protein
MPKPSAQTASITVKLTHAFATTPYAGLAVRVCPSPTDTVCGAALDARTTGADGAAAFTNIALGSPGFDGYFEVVVPQDVSSLELAAPPIVKDDLAWTRYVFVGADVKAILDGVQAQWDKSRGVIVVQANDCRWATAGLGSALAAGVAFALDPPDAQSTVVYFDGKTATAGATSTGAQGWAMIANVTAGSAVSLVGTVASSGKRAGTIKVPVRAGAVTVVTFAPYTPAP